MDFVKCEREENHHLSPTMSSSYFKNWMAIKDHQQGIVETYWTDNYVLYPGSAQVCWLGHILREGDERITKSLLYIEMIDGRNKPILRFKDVRKRDLKSLNVFTDKSEVFANDRQISIFCLQREYLKKEKINKFFQIPK